MRLIDADELIDDLEYDIAIDEDILNYVGTVGAERTNTQFDKDCKQNAIELLMRQPSIDLVRCAECRWSRPRTLKGETGYRCVFYRVDKAETGYCDIGEREGE